MILLELGLRMIRTGDEPIISGAVIHHCMIGLVEGIVFSFEAIFIGSLGNSLSRYPYSNFSDDDLSFGYARNAPDGQGFHGRAPLLANCMLHLTNL